MLKSYNRSLNCLMEVPSSIIRISSDKISSDKILRFFFPTVKTNSKSYRTRGQLEGDKKTNNKEKRDEMGREVGLRPVAVSTKARSAPAGEITACDRRLKDRTKKRTHIHTQNTYTQPCTQSCSRQAESVL